MKIIYDKEVDAAYLTLRKGTVASPALLLFQENLKRISFSGILER